MERKVFKSIRLVLVVFLFVGVLLTPSGTSFKVLAVPACSGSLAQNDDGVYQISSAEDLETMSCLVNYNENDATVGSYVLTQDIDMQEVVNWIPIGTSASSFEGSFDGQGYTIKNLYINQFTTYLNEYYGFEMYSAGLFGNVQRLNNDKFPSIKNVVLDNINVVIEGSEQVNVPNMSGIPEYSSARMYFAGILSSSMQESVVENVSITNSTISLKNIADSLDYSYTKVGSVSAYSNNVVIDHVTSDVVIEMVDDSNSSHENVFVGGLTGNSHKTSINNSTFNGRILVDMDSYLLVIGGLSGNSDFEGLSESSLNIENNHKNNKVVNASIIVSNNGETTVGGLFGRLASMDIIRNYFDGNIESNKNKYELYIGGLSGVVDGELQISESFTKGSIVIESSEYIIGGLVGYYAPSSASPLTVNDVYSRMILSTQLVSDDSNEDPRAIGGLFGAYEEFDNNITNAYYAGQIIENNSSGYVDSIINFVMKDPSTDYGLYFDSDVSVEESLSGLGKTTLEMKGQSTFQTYDFDTVWIMDESFNDGYPHLRYGAYQIAFDPNNNSNDFTQIGSKAVKPSDPVKEGYTFVGWRLENTTSNFDFETLLENNIVLDAYYLANPTTEIVGDDSLSLKATNLNQAYTFSEEQRQQKVAIKLSISELSSLSDDELDLFNNYLESLDQDYDNPFFMDISLLATIGDQQINISEANQEITISFVLPEEYRNQELIFINIHDGEPRAVEMTYNKETFEVSFSSKYFSFFVLASQVVEEVVETIDEQEEKAVETIDEQEEKLIVDTSDDRNYLPWILLVMGLVIIGAEIGLKRKIISK